MKTSTQLIGAVVLSVLGMASAQAEAYHGVLTTISQLSRAEISAEARVTARGGNVYGDAVLAGVTAPRDQQLSRAAVRSGAVQTARAGNVYGNQASAGVHGLRDLL